MIVIVDIKANRVRDMTTTIGMMANHDHRHVSTVASGINRRLEAGHQLEIDRSHVAAHCLVIVAINGTHLRQEIGHKYGTRRRSAHFVLAFGETPRLPRDCARTIVLTGGHWTTARKENRTPSSE